MARKTKQEVELIALEEADIEKDDVDFEPKKATKKTTTKKSAKKADETKEAEESEDALAMEIEKDIEQKMNAEVEVDVNPIDEKIEARMNNGRAVTSHKPSYDPKELEKTKREEKEVMLDKFSAAHKKQIKEEKLDKMLSTMTPDAVRAARFNDEGVIPIEERLQFKTPNVKKKETSVNIEKAKVTGEILTGRVVGTRLINGNIYAKVKYGDYRVLISFEDMNVSTKDDDEYIKSHSGVLADKRKRLLINERAFSEIDFVVVDADTRSRIAIGNRRAAMTRKLLNFYTSRNRNGEFNANEGDRVEARIVMVSATRMTVEVFGKEFVLFPDSISWTRIPNVSAEYNVGDTCAVIIKKLERTQLEEKRWKLNIAVSIKEAYDDPRLDYFRNIEVGDTTTAVVTGVESWGVYCRLEDEDGTMDMLCDFRNGKKAQNLMLETPPEIGSTVLCIVDSLDEENLHIRGSIVHVLNTPYSTAI